MQQEILLVGINLDELLARITSIFESKVLSTSPPFPDNSPPKYLSRVEVAKLLKISLPTLHDWTKLKLLQSYKIGSRVLYKQEEVEAALVNSKNLKYKKIRP